MKTLSRYKLLFIFCSLILSSSIKGQDGTIPPIQSIRIVPQLETYTVSVTNDTSYVYEVEMIINDTTAFTSVQITLQQKNNSQWQTLSNVMRNVPETNGAECQIPLCLFRRNENVWVIHIGFSSLFTSHKLLLHFNNSLINDWSGEF
jgi:hypothetical protein